MNGFKTLGDSTNQRNVFVINEHLSDLIKLQIENYKNSEILFIPDSTQKKKGIHFGFSMVYLFQNNQISAVYSGTEINNLSIRQHVNQIKK